MKHRLEIELDVIIDLSPLEIATKVEQAVREAIERVKQSLGVEMEFDVFVMLDGHAVRYVMESV